MLNNLTSTSYFTLSLSLVLLIYYIKTQVLLFSSYLHFFPASMQIKYEYAALKIGELKTEYLIRET